MSETTDRAPWCPMTGHPMVTKGTETHYEIWKVGCDACGFGASQPMPNKAQAEAHARRLIRAELARQALEMELRLHVNVDACWQIISSRYDLLGAHPLRLPGEGA